MKKRVIGYIAVAAVFFVIGLVKYLPASIAVGWVAGSTPVTFDGVTGTLLHGEAAYASLPAGGVNNLSWSWHPAALLLGRVSADISVDTDLDTVTGSVSRGLFGGTHVSDVEGEATLGWLAKLAGYTFVPVSGRVNLDLADARFDDDLNIAALGGRVDVSRLRYELLNPSVELGQVAARLARPDDGGAAATIVDSHGPLALDGQASLTPDQAYALDVRLRARAGADDRLSRLLEQIGRPDAEGWYRVRANGRL